MQLPFQQQPIAIVGMGCRLPGSSNLDAYWQLIETGSSAIAELPPSRLNQQLYFDPNVCSRPRTITRLGGIVKPYVGLRSNHCLTSKDISISDPAHLELVSVTEDAIAHAGWTDHSFQNKKTGVYVGHTRGTGRTGELVYRSLVPETAKWLNELPAFASLDSVKQQQIIETIVRQTQSEYHGTNVDRPERLEAFQGSYLISRAFGLNGPAISLNAACASSLIALSYASQALRLGTIDVAVVGGGSFVEFDSLVLFSRAGSVSKTGSRPFDAGADGLVAAEGYVILLLKTLQKAIHDGDSIKAVIRGTGYSSDGKGKSLWAPRKEGQVLAIKRAFGETLSKNRIQYIEAHATSTAVGDAIEMAALSEAFSSVVENGGPRIPIGSVKANIGHTLETAGLAGLVKAVLAIQHKIIPPVSYVRELNAKVDWKTSPLLVPPAKLVWEAPCDSRPRRVGVNAFGIGGLNAHIVIDEYCPNYGEKYFEPDREQIKASTAIAKSSNAVGSSMPNIEPIAIIGLGVIASAGYETEEFWKSVVDGKAWLSVPPAERFSCEKARSNQSGLKDGTKLLGGFLKDYHYDWRKHKVPPKQVAAADPLQFMLLDAVDQAIRNTGIPADQIPRQRTGVVIGSVFGGEFGNQLQMGLRLPEFSEMLKVELQKQGWPLDQIDQTIDAYQELLLSRMPALVDETGSFTSSTLASRITKTFDIMGGGSAIDSGGVSGLAALELCANVLRAGDSDLMICAAGQRSCGQMVFNQMLAAKKLNVSGEYVVGNGSGQGIVPGEGAAVVVLKRLSDAQRDGNKIFSVIHSIETFRKEKLKDAFIQVDSTLAEHLSTTACASVDYVEMCANGTKMDFAELESVSQIFGTMSENPTSACSLKEQVGETFGAASLMAVVRASLALFHCTVPAAVSSSSRDRYDRVVFQESSRSIGNGSADHPSSAVVHAACENTVSGVLLTNIAALKPKSNESNATVSIKAQGDRLHSVSLNGSEPILFRFGADTISELLSDLQKCVAQPAGFGHSERREASDWTLSRYRLNVVASNEKTLLNKLGMVIHALDRNRSLSSLQNQGVFFAQRGSSPNAEIAFVYSGQGSQYPGMLASFLNSDKDCKRVKEELDSIVKTLGMESFEALVQDPERLLGVELRRTQVSILGCEILLTEKLRSLNIVPNRVAGHSFGEYGAMVGAGCWDIRTSLQASVMRSDSVSQADVIPGRLLCAFCDEKIAGIACNLASGSCFIANCNTESQTVIGGTEQGLEIVKVFLEKNRIRAVPLNVPFAFHTPLMSSASTVMSHLVGGLNIQRPKILLLSSVSESYVDDVVELRDNLVEQFVKPVRWTHVLDSLSNDGVRLFVEIGPGQVLTGLNRNVFKDRGEILCVATDDPKSSCSQQLVFVRAAFEIFKHLAYSNQKSLRWTLESDSLYSAPNPTFKDEKRTNTERPNRMPLDDSGKRRKLLGDVVQLVATKPVTSPISRDRSNLLAKSELLLGLVHHSELMSLASKHQVTPESLLRWNIEILESRSVSQSHYVSFPVEKDNGLSFHGFHDQIAATPDENWAQFEYTRYAPAGYLKHVVAGSAGQIGGLLGMNEAGLSISSIALRTRETPCKSGLLQSIVTLRVLQEASNLNEATNLLQGLVPVGSWGVLLLDSKSKRSAYVEYDHERFDIYSINESFFISTDGMQAKINDRKSKQGNETCAPSQLLRQLNGSTSDMEAVWNKVMLRTFSTFSESRRSENRHSMQRSSNRGILLSPENFQTLTSIQLDGKVDGVDRPNELNFKSFLVDTNSKNKDGQGPDAAQSEHSQSIPVKPFVSNPFVIEPTELAISGNSKNGKPPLGDQELICTRLVLRLIETSRNPDVEGLELVRNTKAIILGDGPLSQLLSRRLASRGAQVAIVTAATDSQITLKQWQDCVLQMGQPDHLFFMPQSTRLDSENKLIDASRWREEVLTPYLVAQQWFSGFPEEPREQPMLFVVATNMGGDLGLAGRTAHHYGGAWSGLSKAMFLERSVMVGADLRTHAIDFDPTCSDELKVDSILAEVDSKEREAEVAYLNGKRHVLRMVQAPLTQLPKDMDLTSESGCWIVTGGARGVTAEITKRIGKLNRGTIHLVGSSPLPNIPREWLSLDAMQTRELRSNMVRKAIEEKKIPADVWNATEKAIEISKNLDAMANQGIRIQYHACDISSYENVSELVDAIRQRGEPIVGVVHGAGFEKASRFSSKKLPLVMRTIESKVLGAIHLMQATAKDPIRSFVAFTSISGRYGAIGQTDYGTSNEWLAKVVARYQARRPEVHAVAMDWHSWDEVGMAARPETKHSKLLATMRFMPVNEGVDHFMKELSSGTPENEVVITDWQYHKMFFADPVAPVTTKIEPSNTRQSKVNISNDQRTHLSEIHYKLVASPFDCDQTVNLSVLGDVIILGNHPVGHALCKILADRGVPYRWIPSDTVLEAQNSNPLKGENAGQLTLISVGELEFDNRLSRGWQHHAQSIQRSQWLAKYIVNWQESSASKSVLRVVVAASLAGFKANGLGFHCPNTILQLQDLLSLASQSIDVTVADLSTELAPIERASRIFNEVIFSDGLNLVSHNCDGRFRIQREASINSLMSDGTNSDPGNHDDKAVGLFVCLASTTSNESSRHPIFVQQGIATKKLEIYAEDLPLDVDRLSHLQRRISEIRNECGDRIREICVLNDMALEPAQQTLCMASLMELTRPDRLCAFTILNPSPLGSLETKNVSAVEAWMHWYRQDRPEIAVRILEISSESELGISALGFAPTVSKSAETSREIECEIYLDPSTDPFLTQHLFRGRPLLPIVAIAEMFLQVSMAQQLFPSSSKTRLNQLRIVNGLKFLDNEPKRVRVLLQKNARGFEAKLVHSFYDSRGKLMDDRRVIAQATICSADGSSCPAKIVSDPSADWHGVEYPGPEMIIYHGAPFRCLSEVQHVEGGMVAKLHVKSERELGGNRQGLWLTPMGVIDGSLFACGVLAWTHDPSLVAIPQGIESITIQGACSLGEQLLACIEMKSFEKSKAEFDIEIRNQAGGRVASLLGFQTTLVSHNLG